MVSLPLRFPLCHFSLQKFSWEQDTFEYSGKHIFQIDASLNSVRLKPILYVFMFIVSIWKGVEHFCKIEWISFFIKITRKYMFLDSEEYKLLFYLL